MPQASVSPRPRPVFAGLPWAATVVSIAAVAVAFGGWTEQPASPAQRSQPKSNVPPNQRPDRPLPDNLKPGKGEIRHGTTEVPPKPAGAIRLATYNFENFYDPPRPDAEPAKFDSGSNVDPKPDAHRQNLALNIRKVNPDILACQEIESKETLLRFRDQYLADMGYAHVASIDAGDGRGIEQSVLSRFPLSEEQIWLDRDLGGPHPEKLGNRDNPDAGKPMILKRSPFAVTVTVPPPASASAGAAPSTLTLFVVHHKSGAYYGYLREAEARGVLTLINDWTEKHPDSHVIVLGDFNARPWEKSVKTYLDAGFVNAFGPVVLAAGKTDREDPKFVTHASGRAIDQILLSPGAAKAFDIKTRFVLGTPQRPERSDWRTTPPPEGYSSDHYPVVIDLAPAGPSAKAK